MGAGAFIEQTDPNATGAAAQGCLRRQNGRTCHAHSATDDCDIVDDLPERLTTGPAAFCHVDGKFLTQLKVLGSYTVPRIDVQVTSTVQSVPGPEILANFVATNAVVAPSLGRILSGGALAPGDLQPYQAMNERFHDAIISLSGNPWVERFVRQTHAIPFVSGRVILWHDYGVIRRSHDDHHRILAALVARDPARAEDLMREHAVLDRVISTQLPAEYELEYETAEGTNWMDVRAFPTKEGCTVYIRDITQRMRQISRLARWRRGWKYGAGQVLRDAGLRGRKSRRHGAREVVPLDEWLHGLQVAREQPKLDGESLSGSDIQDG